MLIHASKGLFEQDFDFIKSSTDIPLPSKDKLEYDSIVGIANLVLCRRPGEPLPGIGREHRPHFGGIHQEYFGFLFAQATLVASMPCSGKFGIFEIDVDALIAALTTAQAELF